MLNTNSRYFKNFSLHAIFLESLLIFAGLSFIYFIGIIKERKKKPLGFAYVYFAVDGRAPQKVYEKYINIFIY